MIESTRQLLDQLGTAVLFADPMDEPAVGAVDGLLECLEPLLGEIESAAGRDKLLAGIALLRGTPSLESREQALQTIGEALRLIVGDHGAPAQPAPPVQPVAAVAVAAATPLAATPSQFVHRDDDMVSLFGDFLAESGELLGHADAILMNAERDGADPEKINHLFRVFHTIKGVSGFLDLNVITSVAHTTETMLDRCRNDGDLKLGGVALDLVFDATALLRRMLDEVRLAVEKNTECNTAENVDELLSKIRAVTEGRWVPEEPLPFVAPGAKLGEVLETPPLSVPASVVESALEAQKVSGRRLGEELLAGGAVEPKKVAQALRSQGLADDAQPASTLERITSPAPTSGGGAATQLRETIKVDIERVDSLIEMIGELVVVEAQVVGAPEITRLGSVRVRNCLAQLAKVTRDLQDVGMRMRMVPVGGKFQKMERMVRDLARKSDKQVRLTLSGETTEMDRSMVEQIADPLVHMIRNAVDHGIEPAAERIAAGKPAEGQVRLSAYHEGGSSVIELSDDGRGLDRDAILRKAVAQGLVGPRDTPSDEAVYNLIFAPGLSTAKKVTEVSGRGVGMDVVKRNIEALHGRIVIRSVMGHGTTFKIILPLTLAIIDGMLVACGHESYIIPTLSIIESIQPDASMLVTFAERAEMINLRGEILPLLRLDRLFELEGAKQDPTEGLVVIVEGMGCKVGLLVDEVVTQQQVVIKTLGAGLGDVRFVSGAAILADGHVGLILHVEEIAALIENKAFREEVERVAARASSFSPANEPRTEEAHP